MMSPPFERTFPLDTIEITRSGDGRTVEAYAAVFDQPAEVHDRLGHYLEVISRSAFDKTLVERGPTDAIRGQSFRGRIYQSTPTDRAPRRRPGEALPTITRTELGLTEYG